MWPQNPHIKFIGFDEPLSNTSWGIWGDTLKWRGHHGVGDFMYGLNIAYYVSHILNEKITIRFFWDYDESFYWAHDDHETIFERLEYLHSFYHNKNKLVKIDHVYNYPHVDRDFKGEMVLNLRRGYPADAKPLPTGKSNHLTLATELNHWKFADFATKETVKDKVVIWKPFLNANKPNRWKVVWTPWDWEIIIELLEQQNYKIHEIDYRTPVREAMYAIQRCEFVLAYDGMWQYIARNLFKPAIILGDNSIIRTHNPQACWFYRRSVDKKRKKPYDNLFYFLRDLREQNFKLVLDKCETYKTKLLKQINEN